MKTLIAAILVSFTATCAVSAQESTRVATYALRGPVRDMRTETATISKNGSDYVEGPRILSMTVTFNEDGNRPELCLYNEKGVLTRRIAGKFENGKETEYVNYDGAGKMWLRTVYLRNAEGRVRGEETYNGDSSLRSKTTFVRNSTGKMIERSEYSPQDVLLERFTNTYSDAGELETTERSSCRPDGRLSLKEFTNMHEKRVESLTFNPDGSLAGKTIRVNQEITEYGPDGSLKKKTLITNDARLLDESTYNPDGTANRESQIADETDAHGNWVKQTRWVTDAQGRRPVKVIYRTLTYF